MVSIGIRNGCILVAVWHCTAVTVLVSICSSVSACVNLSS